MMIWCQKKILRINSAETLYLLKNNYAYETNTHLTFKNYANQVQLLKIMQIKL